MASPSKSGRNTKTSSAVLEGLDMLAAVAAQELQEVGSSGEESNSGGRPTRRRTRTKAGTSSPAPSSAAPSPTAQKRQQPVVENGDSVSLEQLAAMSVNGLVKMFADSDFNEMKRTYRYTCTLLPTACKTEFQSFGSESKAKKEIQKHLESHVKNLVKEGGNLTFTSDQSTSKNKKAKEKDCKPIITIAAEIKAMKRRGSKQEQTLPIEKENTVSSNCKRRKEDTKPTLSEISNESSSRRFTSSIKKQNLPGTSIKNEDSKSQKKIKIDKNEDGDDSDVLEGDSDNEVKRDRTIDEDHCYSQRTFSRIKAENVSDTESDPEIEENVSNEYAAVNQHNKKQQMLDEAETLSAIQAITDCEVVIDMSVPQDEQGAVFNMQDNCTFTVPTVIQQEVEVYDETVAVVNSSPHIQQPPNIQFQYQSHPEAILPDPTPTTELYQWTDNELLCYTEEVTDKPRTDTRKLKNKRTAAAISQEDQAAALAAMEELRGRGATTEDLVCRLCQPPRPFTAYSTLLTHYRSHAGLRPFECNICQATFTRQHSLNYHLMTHNNQTRFTCPTCNRKFRHPTHYKEHVKKHGETVQFACTMCEVSVSTQVQYRKHLKTKHNKTLDIYGNVIDFTQPDPKEKQTRKRKREPKKKVKEEVSTATTDVQTIEQVYISNPEMFEEVQMINTSSGFVFHQTGEIFASENGQFYQVTDRSGKQNGAAVKTTNSPPQTPIIIQDTQYIDHSKPPIVVQEDPTYRTSVFQHPEISYKSAVVQPDIAYKSAAVQSDVQYKTAVVQSDVQYKTAVLQSDGQYKSAVVQHQDNVKSPRQKKDSFDWNQVGVQTVQDTDINTSPIIFVVDNSKKSSQINTDNLDVYTTVRNSPPVLSSVQTQTKQTKSTNIKILDSAPQDGRKDASASTGDDPLYVGKHEAPTVLYPRAQQVIVKNTSNNLKNTHNVKREAGIIGAISHNVHLTSRSEDENLVTAAASSTRLLSSQNSASLSSVEVTSVAAQKVTKTPPVLAKKTLPKLQQDAHKSGKNAFPAVVALPVHHETAALLPTTILHELTDTTTEKKDILNPQDVITEKESPIVDISGRMIMNDDNVDDPKSVSILERALTEVFPTEDKKDVTTAAASHDADDKVDAKVTTEGEAGGNFGYPGNYMFEHNVDKVTQVSTEAIRDIIGITS